MDFKLHKLWSWMPMEGITLGKHVFIKRLDDKLTLDHELVHVAQQERDGAFRFYLRYILWLPFGWNKYRTAYEAEAYAVQARAGCLIEGEHGLARTLSGSQYGWCCRLSDAEMAIRKYV